MDGQLGDELGVSRPGEFHPQPLAEPDVNVSAHPAPIIQPLRELSGGTQGRKEELRELRDEGGTQGGELRDGRGTQGRK